MKKFYLVYPNETAVEVTGAFLPHENDTLTLLDKQYFVTRVHHVFSYDGFAQNYIGSAQVHIELIL